MLCAIYWWSVIVNVTFKISQTPIDCFINDPHPIIRSYGSWVLLDRVQSVLL